jgi:hypothetical protein
VAKVLSNQGHGRLALLHQDLRLDLREGRASTAPSDTTTAAAINLFCTVFS